MLSDLASTLIPPAAIATRLDALAGEMAAQLPEDGVVLMPVLTGGLVFAADLMRRLPTRLSVVCVGASSYAGARTTSAGHVQLGGIEGAAMAVRGKYVVLVDDILDSGRTLAALREALRQAGAAKVLTCVLLRKNHAGDVHAAADFVAFDIPDAFVVGYGLDFDGIYRNLPGIHTLKPEVVARAQTAAAKEVA